ncbi:MAG: GcrA family cell cycle regulator [Cognatishimia sp.]|uniref:GcrA family cell cycle regulator n=1 Tax=Cognatishimia sp. TaxID=2211648 RepID=UPI0040595A32
MTKGLWTPDRLHQLRTFAADGLTFKQMALRIGVSRNTVIGAARRNDIKSTAKRALPKATLDVARLTDLQTNLAVAEDGTWVPIPTDWRGLDTADLTVSGTGDAVLARIRERDAQRGLRLETLDLSGMPVAGTLDAILHGY